MAILNAVSQWAIPVFIFIVLVFAAWRRINVFDTFVEGGKEGFTIAVQLIPILVAMLVALAIFRESGAFDLLVGIIRPATETVGIPSDVLPLAIMRPISGSGALGMTAELMQRFGPDSLQGLIASTMQGSTDTTFYILTVYFGSVGIRRARYALTVGLLSDLAGFITAVIICKLMFA
ncbi:MAG: spore maturation protein [Firmicutes bacterium]|nr:spore maturation protein [Bacillota bacterium]